MTLRVRTAQMRYAGPDRFDITRKSGGPHGSIFAPSWKILGPALEARKLAKRLRAIGGQEHAARADEAEREAWERYVPAYTKEMRLSYRVHRATWTELLRRESVVLVCYCPNRQRCHRGLLATILTKLGAIDEGEVTP